MNAVAPDMVRTPENVASAGADAHYVEMEQIVNAVLFLAGEAVLRHHRSHPPRHQRRALTWSWRPGSPWSPARDAGWAGRSRWRSPGAGCGSPSTTNSSAEGARGTMDAARKLGVNAELFQADLEDADAARRLPAEVARRFGRLDVLVNSAGIMTMATVEETTPELWDQVMDVNLRSYFFTAQGALPWLREAKGKVVNLADVGGLEPGPATPRTA